MKLRAGLLSVWIPLLASCAPLQQAAMSAPAAGRPELREGGFVSFDGAFLGLDVFMPASAEGQAAAGERLAFVAVHGMNDYAGAFRAAGQWWAERGAVVYAYDQRGFGRSPRPGVWPEPETAREDLRTLTALVGATHPDRRIVVVGESMGASLAATAFASGRPPAAHALVLSGPGLRGWGALPLLYRASLWLSAHVRPAWIVTPPPGVRVTPTDNVEKLREMWLDPYVLKENRIDSVFGVVSLMEEAHEAFARLPHATPTLLLYGARDEVIPEPGVRRSVKRLPGHVRTVHYADGYHMLMNDRQARRVWEDILAFALRPDLPPPSASPPLPFAQNAIP